MISRTISIRISLKELPHLKPPIGNLIFELFACMVHLQTCKMKHYKNSTNLKVHKMYVEESVLMGPLNPIPAAHPAVDLDVFRNCKSFVH